MSRRGRPPTNPRPDAPSAPESQLEGITGKFYTVGRSAHLLYEAYEIELRDGAVVGVRRLSRAPDMAPTAVAACAAELWANLRTQGALDCD